MKYTITSVSQNKLAMAEKKYGDAVEAMAEFMAMIADPETVTDYDMISVMEEQEEGYVILAACSFTEGYRNAVKCTVKP